MSYIKIVDRVTTTVTDPEDPNYSWSRDSTAQDHDIVGFKVVKEGDYFDLTVPFTPKKGKTYWLVYVNYDTGDSFGNDDGCASWIDLFESEELADKLARAIREDSKNDGFNTLKYELDNGEIGDCYVGAWKGYFEHFNSVEVVPVKIFTRP